MTQMYYVRRNGPHIVNESLAIDADRLNAIVVDDGRSGTVRDGIDNVIVTIGYAVHFNRVHTACVKDAVERIFCELTRSSLQRPGGTP